MFLDNLVLFLRIVEKKGMAAAGRELGLSPATVSERLASLELYYDAKLFNRTTRSISLTEEGRMLVEGARSILAEAEELESRIKLGVKKISGPIRLSVPTDLGRNRIAPLLNQFLKEHPDIKIDLVLNDGYVDLARQGIDLALRYGALTDSTLISKLLGTNSRKVCASPDYLKSHGTPQHPDDLTQHNCILMRFGDAIDNVWKFSIDGRQRAQMVQGNRIVNDGDLVRSWCCDGHGIALKSIWDIYMHLNSGALIEILKDYAPTPTSIQLVYSSSTTQPRRIRLLIDHLADWFNNNSIEL